MTDVRRMYRYQVPIDDRPHVIPLDGNPLAVACVPNRPATSDDWHVEFWAEHTEGEPGLKRTFQVFGTGHALPEDAKWVGTCARVRGLVFHLYEIGRGHP